jgi:hypothetical protein
MTHMDASAGEQLLRELRDRATAEEASAVLLAFAGGRGLDRSYERLRERTDGAIDPLRADHREALLAWLRSWGCRHLRLADGSASSAALLAWWHEHHGSLPARRGATLTSLAPRRLARAADAYEALARTVAARRVHGDEDVGVTFGDTAASKALFALRPAAFPPWDEPMRAAFGWRTADAARYRRYLELSADALRGLAARLGVPVASLPRLLGRPAATPARLVDEYLWARVARGSGRRVGAAG